MITDTFEKGKYWVWSPRNSEVANFLARFCLFYILPFGPRSFLMGLILALPLHSVLLRNAQDLRSLQS